MVAANHSTAACPGHRHIGGGEGEEPGGEGEGPGGGGGGGGGGAAAADISVFSSNGHVNKTFLLYHAYTVVCVWIWHVIGQLRFDPSTRAGGLASKPRARASRVGVGIRMYVCSAWLSGGPPCAFLACSMATEPGRGVHPRRMHLLNGGWGIFSRWPHPLTYPGRFPAWVIYGARNTETNTTWVRSEKVKRGSSDRQTWI